ncbi:MAG: hypothetical protein DI590_05405 [Methylorubrum populi]|jgi:hypothetical protein|nr:hypothetical protein AX289_15015 [Methylorubrum populi]PZP71700.1 MAG: hypothetical protein DI590_05405 [Methylorubrum populi]
MIRSIVFASSSRLVILLVCIAALLLCARSVLALGPSVLLPACVHAPDCIRHVGEFGGDRILARAAQHGDVLDWMSTASQPRR